MDIQEIDYEFKRGDTSPLKKFSVELLGEQLVPDGSFQIYFTVKKSKSSDVAIQKTLNNGITYKDGFFRIQLESYDTSDLAEGAYLYDISLKTETLTKTMFEGTINIIADITTRKDEV